MYCWQCGSLSHCIIHCSVLIYQGGCLIHTFTLMQHSRTVTSAWCTVEKNGECKDDGTIPNHCIPRHYWKVAHTYICRKILDRALNIPLFQQPPSQQMLFIGFHEYHKWASWNLSRTRGGKRGVTLAAPERQAQPKVLHRNTWFQ